jgi:hypothetical protein
MILPVVPPLIPQFTHLPEDLARRMADLPPLRQRGRGRQAPIDPAPASAFALGSAFELAPAHAPALAPSTTTHYQHLPPDLARQLADLPSLPQRPQRGRGRGRRNIPAPAPAPIEEIRAQYAALPPVCILYFFFSMLN